MSEKVKLSENQIKMRKAIFEVMEEVIDKNREYIAAEAAKRLQKQGIEVKK